MSSAESTAAPSSYGATLQRLGAAQKTVKGAPAYSRFVNRPLGRRLAALSHLAGLRPNQVTGLSGLCSGVAIAAVALVRPSLLLGVLVTVLLVLGYALDAADGQLARLQGSGSPSGEFLDHVVDAVKISSLHAAVLVSSYRFADLGTDAWLLVPLGFQVVGAVFFFGMILVEQIRRAHGVRPPSGQGSAPQSRLKAVFVVPTDYGLLCLAFLLLGWPAGFLAAYTALFAGTAAFVLLALPKWYREISAFGARG